MTEEQLSELEAICRAVPPGEVGDRMLCNEDATFRARATASIVLSLIEEIRRLSKDLAILHATIEEAGIRESFLKQENSELKEKLGIAIEALEEMRSYWNDPHLGPRVASKTREAISKIERTKDAQGD